MEMLKDSIRHQRRGGMRGILQVGAETLIRKMSP